MILRFATIWTEKCQIEMDEMEINRHRNGAWLDEEWVLEKYNKQNTFADRPKC